LSSGRKVLERDHDQSRVLGKDGRLEIAPDMRYKIELKRNDLRSESMKKTWAAIILAVGIIFSTLWAQGQATVPDPVTKILKQSCAVMGCHRGSHPAKSLNLEPDEIIVSAVNVPSRQMPSLKIIDTQSPEKSYLMMKIRGDKDIAGRRMPKGRTHLTDEEIQAMQDWILSLQQSGVQAPGDK